VKTVLCKQEVCKFCLTGLRLYYTIGLTIKFKKKNGSIQAVVLDLTRLTEAEQGHAERGMQSRYV